MNVAEVYGKGLETVPKGFSDWVVNLENSGAALSSTVSKLLSENNVCPAIEVFEQLGQPFLAWLKIIKVSNPRLYSQIEILLATENTSVVVEVFGLLTKENINRVWQ